MAEPGTDFRDHIATADERGRRIWVFPTKPRGRLHRWRAVVAAVLLVILFGVPFVRINGYPLLQLDVLNRKFFIFGQVFWPQDLYLFVLFAISLAVFIVLFTAAWGRIFCGWICPQTIFMEMVFRKIEYWIDGDAPKQRALTNAPWTPTKIGKRLLKHGIFFGISFLIGNTLLAYFIGTDALFDIVTSPPSEHLSGFVMMVIFSLVFYWIFSWFREQVCTLVCPYGRLQSVLIDANSIVVAYDHKRGEPRGPVTKGDENPYGDCIDCGLCVRVCPTGIDIRNGTQLECVNCTACIDACDEIMDKVNRPRGLIRYASEENILHGTRMRFTPRMKLYTAVLSLLLIITAALLVMRTEVQAVVLRTAGSMFEELPDGSIRNVYTIRVTNKTNEHLDIALRLLGDRGTLTVHGPNLVVEPTSQDETVFSIQVPREQLHSPNTLMEIGVFAGDRELTTVRTSFAGPMPGASR